MWRRFFGVTGLEAGNDIEMVRVNGGWRSYPAMQPYVRQFKKRAAAREFKGNNSFGGAPKRRKGRRER